MASTQPDVKKYQEDTPSGPFLAKVSTSIPNIDEYYMNVAVFLEGVQVPVNGVTIGYGVNTPPTCTILLPAHRVLRSLPETTKIHVFFQDMLPDETGTYHWRLLFDGELAGYGYTTTADGAHISITGLHSTAYLTLMQIITLDVAKFLFTKENLIGAATLPVALNNNHIDSNIIKDIIEGKNNESMADIVFQLIRAILDNVDQTAVGKYYQEKLGNVPGGWKMLKRIFGVSAKAMNAAIPKVDWNMSGSQGSGGTSTPSADAVKEDLRVADPSGAKYVVKQGVDIHNVRPEVMGKAKKIIAAYNKRYPDDEIWITDGYRPQDAGYGAAGSYHKQGLALDADSDGFKADSAKKAYFAELCRQEGFGEVIGTYTTSSHVHFGNPS
jgi:hypothetical protein